MFNYHLGKCNKHELEQEILRLKKQIKELEGELDVLKNATLIIKDLRDTPQLSQTTMEHFDNVLMNNSIKCPDLIKKFPNNQITLTKKKNK